MVVTRELKKGDQSKGFTISDSHDADNLLTVEIRGLADSTSTGFFTGGVHIKGAFKGLAKSAGTKMQKMYRYEKEERVIIVPTAETNEEWINQALTETLTKLLDDPEMLAFLSKLDKQTSQSATTP